MSKDVKIVVRAFNRDGYHKDILVACSDQVRMSDTRVNEPRDSMMSGLSGHGGRITPEDFPEMTHFEVVVTEYPRRNV